MPAPSPAFGPLLPYTGPRISYCRRRLGGLMPPPPALEVVSVLLHTRLGALPACTPFVRVRHSPPTLRISSPAPFERSLAETTSREPPTHHPGAWHPPPDLFRHLLYSRAHHLARALCNFRADVMEVASHEPKACGEVATQRGMAASAEQPGSVRSDRSIRYRIQQLQAAHGWSAACHA